MSRLIKKYPRLCSNIDANVKCNLELRSDLWMIRFMEDCYNDAYVATFKDVSKDRKRKRCGLDLGSMDAFPLVVQRLIERVYRLVIIIGLQHALKSM